MSIVQVEYQSYIRSPAWRAKRSTVIARAKGVCEKCKKWPVVNVHHLNYERLGGELPNDLLGVCTKCHKEVHRES